MIFVLILMPLSACRPQARMPSPPTPTATAMPPTATATSPPTATPEPTVPPSACDKLTFGNEQGIYLVNPDGSELTQLAGPLGFIPYGLEWSPDGRWLIYNDGSMYNRGVYALSADGAIRKQLSSSSEWRAWWEWSPDSQYVIEAGCNSTTCWHAVLRFETGEIVCDFVSAAGTYGGWYVPVDCDPLELSDGTLWYLRGYKIPIHEEFDAYSHRLSPNGEWVILWTEHVGSGQRSWQVVRVNGEGLRPIVGIPEDDYSPCIAWHPDSRHFAFVTTQDDRDDIWAAQTINEDVSLLTHLPSGTRCPALKWSASGRYISCGSYIVEWPSGQMHALPERAREYEQLRWSSSGDYLLIESSGFWIWDAGKQELISMDADLEECEWAPSNSWLACREQGDVTVLSLPVGDAIRVNTAGDLTATEWAPTGRWLVVFEVVLSDEGKDSLYIVDVTTGMVVQVADQVNPWSFAWTPSCAMD